MRILVTGAGGFIGRNFCAAAAAAHEVFALARSVASVPTVPGVVPVMADLAEMGAYEALPPSVDAVVHLAQANAAFPDKACELFAVNAQSTVRLLDYAVRAGAKRFLFASSGDVYGPREDACGEDDPADPRSFYAVTKYASELAIRAYAGKLGFCIVRLFRPYGPGQRGRAVPNVITDVLKGRPVAVHAGDRPLNTPIHVDDVVEGLKRALASPFCGTLNFAGDETVSLKGVAERAAAIAGVGASFRRTGQAAANCLGRNELMKQILGTWETVPLARGIEACVDEIRNSL